MKKLSVILFFSFVIIGFGLAGCDEDTPSIEEYANSGCLPESEASDESDKYPFCGNDQVETSVEGNEIYIIHRNATYNCCPADIKVSLSVEGNKLKLSEEEIPPAECDCMCCYNVEATIVDLSAGTTYTLEYCWDDYDTGSEECVEKKIVILFK